MKVLSQVYDVIISPFASSGILGGKDKRKFIFIVFSMLMVKNNVTKLTRDTKRVIIDEWIVIRLWSLMKMLPHNMPHAEICTVVLSQKKKKKKKKISDNIIVKVKAKRSQPQYWTVVSPVGHRSCLPICLLHVQFIVLTRLRTFILASAIRRSIWWSLEQHFAAEWRLLSPELRLDVIYLGVHSPFNRKSICDRWFPVAIISINLWRRSGLQCWSGPHLAEHGLKGCHDSE